MKKNPEQTYGQLLNSIRDELATKYTQKPQLSCSHPLSKKFSPLLLMVLPTRIFIDTIPRYQYSFRIVANIYYPESFGGVTSKMEEGNKIVLFFVLVG
jgi:hypothetical protein